MNVMPVRHFCQIVLLGLAMLWPASSPVAQTLVLGVAGPITGPLQDAGKAMAAGARAAATKFNADGQNAADAPFNKIEIIIADDGGSQNGAMIAARKLAATKARAVIGHYSSALSISTAPVYAAHNIIMIAPAATAGKLAEASYWNVIRMGADDQAQAIFAAKRLANDAPGPVAIVHDGTSTARKHAQDVQNALVAMSRHNARTFELSAGNAVTNMPPLAASLRKNKIAALYWTGTTQPGAQLRKALQMGSENAPTIAFLASEEAATPDFAETAGQAVEGVEIALPLSLMNPAYPAGFEADMKKAGVSQLSIALAAYAAVEICAQAFNKNRKPDAPTLADILRSGQPFKTIAGAMSFNAQGGRREPLYGWMVWRLAADGKPMLAPRAQ